MRDITISLFKETKQCLDNLLPVTCIKITAVIVQNTLLYVLFMLFPLLKWHYLIYSYESSFFRLPVPYLLPYIIFKLSY